MRRRGAVIQSSHQQGKKPGCGSWLARDGLVRFAPNPHHERAKLVLLTAAGKAAYATATERQMPWANALAKGLPVAAIGAARATLAALRERLSE